MGAFTALGSSAAPRELVKPSDGYFYHVTLYANLEGIAEHGLRPDAGTGIGGGAYDFHRKGRVFLTVPEGVFFWFSKAEEHADYNTDDPIEDGATPVVLRVWENSLPEEVQIDDLGTRDAGHREAVFVTKTIDADVFEVWNGEEWVVLVDEWNSIDPESSYTFEEPDPPEECDCEEDDEDCDCEEAEPEEPYAVRKRETPLFPPELAP